ncbi:MAG: CPBP family glutamic-type intramembrane protease [Acidimicrobiia bacterium]
MTHLNTVTYDLAQWPGESRDALRRLLVDAEIDAQWAASTFAVPAARRSDVDALVASLNGTAANRAVLYQARQTVAAPGWYPDPMREALWRWWDGQRWTGYVGPQLPPRDRGWFPPKNDREQTAKGGGLAIAGFVGGQMLSLGVVGLAIALGASSRSAVTLLVGELALWSGLFGACKLAVRRYGTGTLRDLGLLRPQLGDLGIGSLAALVARVATLIIAVILVLVFSFDDLARDTSVTNEAGISTLGAIVVVIVAVFGAPFFEELFFRGLVQGVLTRRYGGRIAICAQAVAFGLVHYQIGMTRGQMILTFSMIIPVGFLLGCIRWRYERLGPGMAAHAVFNGIAVAITLATL